MTPKGLTTAREAEIRALLTDPHRAVCSFEYAAQVAARELLDELTRLRERLAEAEGLLGRCANALEVQLSSDPQMPSYSRDLDEAEEAMQEARRFLNERPQEEP